MGKGDGSRDLAKEKFWRQMLARQKASGKTQKNFVITKTLITTIFNHGQVSSAIKKSKKTAIVRSGARKSIADAASV
jgi:hypothetical protein